MSWHSMYAQYPFNAKLHSKCWFYGEYIYIYTCIKELENQDFAKFAFEESRYSTSTKSPPSDNALNHLQTAYDSISRCIANCRKHGMAMNKHGQAIYHKIILYIAL